MKEQTKNIGMPVKGELLRMLEWVMQHRGIHNKTEIVRVLISEEYKRNHVTVELMPSTAENIASEIRRSGQKKTVPEFIEDAVKWFLDEKRKR